MLPVPLCLDVSLSAIRIDLFILKVSFRDVAFYESGTTKPTVSMFLFFSLPIIQSTYGGRSVLLHCIMSIIYLLRTLYSVYSNTHRLKGLLRFDSRGLGDPSTSVPNPPPATCRVGPSPQLIHDGNAALAFKTRATF